MSSFRVGVLSDPHTKSDLQQDAIANLKKNGAEYLLHLGDFVIKENIDSLANSNLIYRGVFGNNDNSLMNLDNSYSIHKEPYYAKIKDVTFKLMHLPYYLSADCDVILFGHTHKFECSLNGSSLFLNPGEVCAREKPLSEHALIEVSSNQFIVSHYFKEPTSKSWSSSESIFKRESL